MYSSLDMTIFITCIIIYIGIITYCAYRCRGQKNDNSTEYVEV